MIRETKDNIEKPYFFDFVNYELEKNRFEIIMKQYEAVIKVMESNGGYATLGFLNQQALQIEDCEWKAKTPFASIRLTVQDGRFFFKISPGLWALKFFRDKLPTEILPSEDQTKEKKGRIQS